LFNFDDIKEACIKSEFAARPSGFAGLVRSYGQKFGIIFNDGPTWVEHRRFALRHLRDLGVGKNPMESIALSEFDELAKEMTLTVGTPMKVNFRFNLTVLNILWRIVADQRFASDDPEGQKYVDSVNEFFSTIGPQNLMNTAPWTRHILPELSGYRKLIQHRDTCNNMFSRLMQEHRQTLDRDNPRDLIDRYLLEMETPDAEERGYTERNIGIIGMDLFIAGMETTSTSLSWSLLFIVRHPEIQQRVQSEIDRVLGERAPIYADRKDMPYTEATLMEVTRRGTVLPNAVPHATTCDTTLRGYDIPKGTFVLMHQSAVHMDPEYWGDPEAFRPERFVNADGSVRRDERLIPFGVGKRACLGESLARMELFVLFTCLLQKFRFEAAPGETLSLEPAFSVVQQPAEFSVVYQARDLA